jgi:hypothetical protein
VIAPPEPLTIEVIDLSHLPHLMSVVREMPAMVMKNATVFHLSRAPCFGRKLGAARQ